MSECVSERQSVIQSVRRGVSESSNIFSSGKSVVLKVAWQCIVRREVSECVSERVSVSHSVSQSEGESASLFSSGKSVVLKVAWQCIYLVVKNNRNSQHSVFVQPHKS